MDDRWIRHASADGAPQVASRDELHGTCAEAGGREDDFVTAHLPDQGDLLVVRRAQLQRQRRPVETTLANGETIDAPRDRLSLGVELDGNVPRSTVRSEQHRTPAAGQRSLVAAHARATRIRQPIRNNRLMGTSRTVASLDENQERGR